MPPAVKLRPESREYIKRTFEQYKPGTGLVPTRFAGKIVIHVYPTADTLDARGKLCGYADALFFRFVVYDVDRRVFWEVRKRDSIRLHGLPQAELKVFKDGSYMVTIPGPSWLVIGQSVAVFPDKAEKKEDKVT